MAFVNIPRDRDDPNYRYKMPRLYSKIEGRGNGIKTNITNMGEIAKALKRPPMYPTKFFGCELGAQCKYEEAEEKSLVNGAHAEKDLIEILDKFIAMYVLCPGCGLPEMDMIVKRGILSSNCNACGHQSSLDMQHKAANYMMKNPPDQGTSTVVHKKKSKDERKAEKDARKCDDEEDDHDNNGVGDDKKKKKKKDKGKKKSKKSKSRDLSEDETKSDSDKTPTVVGLSSLNSNDNVSRVDSEEPSAEKVAEKEEKKKKKGSGVSNEKLQFNDKMTFQSAELEEITERLYKSLYKDAIFGGLTPTEFFQELRLIQVAQDFDQKIRLYVSFRALFGKTLSPADFDAKAPFIKKVTEASTKVDDIFSTLEYFVNEDCGGQPLSDYPYIIQKIYNNLIVDSEGILKYYSKDGGNAHYNACKNAAAPVLQWLEDNETEEEPTSDEEDDI